MACASVVLLFSRRRNVQVVVVGEVIIVAVPPRTLICARRKSPEPTPVGLMISRVVAPMLPADFAALKVIPGAEEALCASNRRIPTATAAARKPPTRLFVIASVAFLLFSTVQDGSRPAAQTDGLFLYSFGLRGTDAGELNLLVRSVEDAAEGVITHPGECG
jgi:hypothetical protein